MLSYSRVKLRNKSTYLIPAAVLLLAPGMGLGADDFLALMRKAENRSEAAERIEYFSRAIEAWTPNHGNSLLANCLFRRGEAHYRRYEFTTAVPDLDRALDLDPRNARAFYLRGRIRLHEALLGPDQAKSALLAVKDLAEYCALNPEDAAGLTDLGRAQTLASRITEALSSFSRAQSLAPRDPAPRLGAARAFMVVHDWKTALDQLDRASRMPAGRRPEIYEERAACLARLGDRAAALAALERGLRLHEETLQDWARSGGRDAEISESNHAMLQARELPQGLKKARGDEPKGRPTKRPAPPIRTPQ